MSDYLSHLAARQHRPTEGVRPRVSSYFAPEARVVERDEAQVIDTRHEHPGALPRAPIGPVQSRREPWSAVGQALMGARSMGDSGSGEARGTTESGSLTRDGARGATGRRLDVTQGAPESGVEEAQDSDVVGPPRSESAGTRTRRGGLDTDVERTMVVAPVPSESLATSEGHVIQQGGASASPALGLAADGPARTDLSEKRGPAAPSPRGPQAPPRSAGVFPAVRMEPSLNGEAHVSTRGSAVARPVSPLTESPAERQGVGSQPENALPGSSLVRQGVGVLPGSSRTDSSAELARARAPTSSEQGLFDERSVPSAVGQARTLAVALEAAAPAQAARSSPETARRESNGDTAPVHVSQGPAAPVIQVTIGRIEVRAVSPSAPARSAPSRAAPSPSLEEYLARRNGGGR